MRLLLTFLALLTGFSAAEAARPVEAASTTSAASQLELAEALATAAATVAETASGSGIEAGMPSAEADMPRVAPATPVATTPVSRADRARE